jgi:hypothetical protein
MACGLGFARRGQVGQVHPIAPRQRNGLVSRFFEQADDVRADESMSAQYDGSSYVDSGKTAEF